MPNHFLAAGVYGCVYYPGYTCKGEPMKRKQWVSKLTYDNSVTRNEIEVGQRLKDLPHFIIVERKCPIAYDSLTKMKKGCDLVTKKKKYILLYSKYAASKELYSYFKENPAFFRVFRCYYQICDLISSLIEHKVVHHDLHFANILYSTETSNLLLIDFGLSFLVDKMENRDYLKFVFNHYMPKWSWYPLEIHLLTYLLQEGELTESVLRETVDMYLENHSVLQHFLEFRHVFREESIKYFKPWIGSPDAIEHFCSFWNTWDYYDIALRFLYMYAQNHVAYPAYKENLFDMIHPNPEKRPNSLKIRNNNKQAIQAFDLNQTTSVYRSLDQTLLASHKDASHKHASEYKN